MRATLRTAFVTLNSFPGPRFRIAPVNEDGWMLRHVQHDGEVESRA